MASRAREAVSFIRTRSDDDLVVAYAFTDADSEEILNVILHRNPRLEERLAREKRGVVVSHDGFSARAQQPWILDRLVVNGAHVDIETSARRFCLDVAGVDPKELASARKVLLRMHRFGGFVLEVR